LTSFLFSFFFFNSTLFIIQQTGFNLREDMSFVGFVPSFGKSSENGREMEEK
jgi:hypothetical protein